MSDQDEVKLCTLRVGEAELAVDIMRVREITTIDRVTGPAAFGLDGVLEVHGRMATVIDLRRRLRLPPLPRARGPRVLVVSAGADLLALVADRIGDVVRVPASSLKALPRQGTTSLIAGATRHQGRVLLLLDVLGLLAATPARRRSPSRRRAGNG